MGVYTRSGDSGQTSLLGGKRLSKASLRIDSYGTVDELNAVLGSLADQLAGSEGLIELHAALIREMNALFSLGSFLATPIDLVETYKTFPPSSQQVNSLEKEIDGWEGSLPPLKNFILPTGHSFVSSAHIARTVARRAERNLVHLSDVEPEVAELKDAITYLNRLSDWLFVFARMVGSKLGVKEVIWGQPDNA